LPVWLENAYSRPKNWGFRGISPLKWGAMSTKPQKAHPCASPRRLSHLEKSQKSRYLRNGLTDLYEIWLWFKITKMLTAFFNIIFGTLSFSIYRTV